MLLKILAAFGAAALLFLLLWVVRGSMLTPVRIGRNARLEMRLTVSGTCPELEESVDALLWLRENGTIRADIVVSDRGMDENTRLAAAILERKGLIKLISEDDK